MADNSSPSLKSASCTAPFEPEMIAHIESPVPLNSPIDSRYEAFMRRRRSGDMLGLCTENAPFSMQRMLGKNVVKFAL